MRILISPVGDQDPFSVRTDEEGSVVTICRQIAPDIVYLLPTMERPDVRSSTAKAAEETRKWLQEGQVCARVYIKPLDVSDPTDYAQVLPRFEDAVRAILAETKSDAEREFYVNASSATPQIKTAGMLLVASGVLQAKVLQVANPQQMTRPQRVQEVNVTFLREGQLIDNACNLFERCQFEAAAMELRQLAAVAYHYQRRVAAEAVAEIYDGYAHLDRMQYHQAWQSLQRALKRGKATAEFRSVQGLLEEQVATLDNLRQSRVCEDFLLLCDIYHNAARRLRTEGYVDALARVWRIIEGSLFAYLRRNHGIEPAELSRSSDQGKLRLVQAAYPGARSSLSFATSLGTLKEVFRDQEIGRLLHKHLSPSVLGFQRYDALLDGLRERRNKSVVAHGVAPVDAPTAELGMFAAQELLEFVFAGRRVADYPFAADSLGEIGRATRRLLVGGE